MLMNVYTVLRFGVERGKKAGVKHHGTGCICVSSPPTGEMTHIQLQLNHLLYSSRPELYHGCRGILI